MSGSSGGGTTTTTNSPWWGQQRFLIGQQGQPGLFPAAADLYQNYDPQYYQGAQVAGQQPGTQAAQQYLWNYAGLPGQSPGPTGPPGAGAPPGSGVQPAAPDPGVQPPNIPGSAPGTLPNFAGGTQAANALLQDPSILYADSNPALQSYIDAAVRPVYQGLTESALPAIRSEYGLAGQYGGSRQGIAEGLAISRAGQTAGDISAGIASQGYGQGLEGMARGIALAPQTGQFGATPATLLDTVGQQNQLYQQALIDSEMRKFAYEQNLPYEQLREYASIVGGPGYGGVSTTEGPASRTNTALSALGGAATGAALGTQFGGPGWGTGIGAGIGVLAGLFA